MVRQLDASSLRKWLIILLSLFTHLCETSTHPAVLPSGKVIGTVITACGNATFHTPAGDPYPTRSGRHLWLTDSHTPCLSDSSAALEYCRKVYTAVYPQLMVDHVIVDPFKIVPDLLPWFPPNASSAIRVYLCLGPTPTDANDGHLTVEATDSPTDHTRPTTAHTIHQRLPTLVDVHRVYFAEQFHHLWNKTHSNVSQIISQLVKQTKGLFKLYPTDPQLAQYNVSEMLKKAHERLQRIWTAEEHEWSVLEQKQHEDLAAQLSSDEWAGENMFTFALQESHRNVSRIQDALSVLLSRLADSVSEEVRHLKSVHNRQPWMLLLNSSGNWTANMQRGITDLEQVHQILLKHVRVATLAINTFHSVMAEDVKLNPLPNTSSNSPPRYKTTLVASYDRLQANLFEAQRLLNQAKTTLLGNLTSRMNSILNHMNETLLKQHGPLSLSNISMSDWVNSKHHAELAYIDLLVARLLSPYVSSIELPVDEEKAQFIWQPIVYTTQLPQSESTQGITVWSRDRLLIVLTIVLSSVSLLSTFLFCFIRMARSAPTPGSDSCRRSRFRSLLYRSGHKLKHLVSDSQQKLPVGTSSVWRVAPRVVVVDNDQFATQEKQAEIHGYANPVCPTPRG